MEKMHTFFGEQYWSCLIGRYDEDRNKISFYFHFKRANIWQRIRIAVTYIFKPGGELPNNHTRCFIEFSLQSNDKTRMINLIRKLKDDR